MIREKVTIQDYERITKENEYLVWNFIIRGNYPLEIFSFFEETEERHTLREVLTCIDIPYFESDIDNDSIDFLINLEISPYQLWKKNGNGGSMFYPVFIGFNKGRKINSSAEGYCYCKDGLIDLIYELEPKFILNAKLD